MAAIQPQNGDVPRSRFGLHHPAVVVTGPADDPQCHIAPAGWARSVLSHACDGAMRLCAVHDHDGGAPYAQRQPDGARSASHSFPLGI